MPYIHRVQYFRMFVRWSWHKISQCNKLIKSIPSIFVTEVDESVVTSTTFTRSFKDLRARSTASLSMFGDLFCTSLLSTVSQCNIAFLDVSINVYVQIFAHFHGELQHPSPETTTSSWLYSCKILS